MQRAVRGDEARTKAKTRVSNPRKINQSHRPRQNPESWTKSKTRVSNPRKQNQSQNQSQNQDQNQSQSRSQNPSQDRSPKAKSGSPEWEIGKKVGLPPFNSRGRRGGCECVTPAGWGGAGPRLSTYQSRAAGASKPTAGWMRLRCKRIMQSESVMMKESRR